MDARMLELVALALFTAALGGVAINVQHVMGAGVFAGLSAAIVLLAVVLRRSQ
jgi:predicted membrane protein